MYNNNEYDELRRKVGKLFIVNENPYHSWVTFESQGKQWFYTGDKGKKSKFANQMFLLATLEVIDFEFVTSFIFKEQTVWTYSPRLFLKSCTQLTF